MVVGWSIIATLVQPARRICPSVIRQYQTAKQRVLPFAPNGDFIEPDQADATCPVLPTKIFRLTRRANHFYNSRRPVPKEGRCATSSTRKGMRWTRRRRKTSGASRGRRSRVVLTPRRWRQVGDDAFASRRRWWQKSPVTKESAL